jgi:hypothetical protein
MCAWGLRKVYVALATTKYDADEREFEGCDRLEYLITV